MSNLRSESSKQSNSEYHTHVQVNLPLVLPVVLSMNLLSKRDIPSAAENRLTSKQAHHDNYSTFCEVWVEYACMPCGKYCWASV